MNNETLIMKNSKKKKNINYLTIFKSFMKFYIYLNTLKSY